MAEGMGIEPIGDNTIAPRTALKAGTATRRHPLPPVVYNVEPEMANERIAYPCIFPPGEKRHVHTGRADTILDFGSLFRDLPFNPQRNLDS